MKLLFDQNISFKILKVFPSQYQDSSHVRQEGLINALDKQIWEFAKLHDYAIVTQDSDFNDLNVLYGFPPKIIWVRTGNLKTLALLNILINYSEDLIKFINDNNYGCYEILRIEKNNNP